MLSSKKKKVWTGMAAAVLAVSGVASAGYKHDYEAFVGDGFAGGALGSIRNSADSVQYASVQVRDNTWAWFFVTDENGKQRSCTTVDPELIALARSVNPASYVYFEFDKSGECSSVSISTASYLEPPLP